MHKIVDDIYQTGSISKEQAQFHDHTVAAGLGQFVGLYVQCQFNQVVQVRICKGIRYYYAYKNSLKTCNYRYFISFNNTLRELKNKMSIGSFDQS